MKYSSGSEGHFTETLKMLNIGLLHSASTLFGSTAQFVLNLLQYIHIDSSKKF